MDKTSGGTVTRTVTYYPAAGAMRINISGGSNSVYYILKDQLGSASVVTDSTGTIVGEQRYYPYGETRFTNGTIYTDKLFTGQRDVGLGIYHYGARFYSPKLGRFLSPDTIVPGAGNPQAWNRYSYVLGNPLKYIDPTGHMQYDDDYKSSNGKCSKGDTSCNWVGKSKNKAKPKPKGGGNNGNQEGGGGDKPLLKPNAQSDILCGALAGGDPCVENNLSSAELDYLVGDLYDQSNSEIAWGTSLLIAGATIGAVVTVAALAIPAAALVGTTALLVGAGVGLALGLSAIGGLLAGDGALQSNLASQISNAAGSGNTEMAFIGSTNLAPTIAVYGDALTTFTSYSPIGSQTVFDHITNP